MSADRTAQDYWRDIDQNCLSETELVLIKSKKQKVWLSAWPLNPKPAVNLSNFNCKTHESALCYNEKMEKKNWKNNNNQESPNAKEDLSRNQAFYK